MKLTLQHKSKNEIINFINVETVQTIELDNSIYTTPVKVMVVVEKRGNDHKLTILNKQLYEIIKIN